MDTARLVEALLEGAIASGVCPELRCCVPATGEVLPAQYVLLVRDRPRTRAALRRAAQGLLALLDAADGAYLEGNREGCGKLHALAAAPDWLLHPSDPDDSDPDVALVWEREVDHGGDWESLLDALHRAGSVEWQGAIRRCRTLMRFEAETGTDLAALIGIPASRAGDLARRPIHSSGG
jgi:hypothetical protein